MKIIKNQSLAFVSKSLKDTKNIAEKFVEDTENTARVFGAREHAVVVAMYGDLGSGKTTFVKAIASAFGIENTVTSPTFVIEKIYPIRTDGRSKLSAFNGTSQFENLIHIDAYRLKSGEELKSLGWEDISKNPKNIIFIEWPERIIEILPDNIKKIHFTFIDENVREIEIILPHLET
ncbi:MAG: tRNA (adenosine(37)-N6)-threonylcarbamoyltransferase complex ATPase subunit type 1 TsaE [Patescibacteria group bacterium]